MIKVLVNGANGRMGKTVCEAVESDSELELVARVDVFGDDVEKDLQTAIDKFKPEVMIDFTRPDVVLQNVLTALKNRVAVVVGTTGLNSEAKSKIKSATEEFKTPAFIAPNFAIGAVLMMLFAKQAAKYLPDVEIIELHHDKKLDAPSGTALQTAEMISEVRPKHKQGHPDEVEKLTGARGSELDGIRIHSVRLPGYVAHQEVIFGGSGQILTIRHDSMDRYSFMPGVILACKKVLELDGLTVGLDKILE